MFLHSSELAGRNPKQDCPSQSPATINSFNNSYFENEEDLPREIARDLGVSYADKNTCKDKMKYDVINSSIFPQSAAVMGTEQNDP